MKSAFLSILAVGFPALAWAATPLTVTLAGQALVRFDARRSAPESFAEMQALWRGSDVVFTNLEAAVSGPKAEAPTRGDELLHAIDPSVLDSLKAEGFNLLALSNNHTWDLNTGGVLSTLEAVDSRHLAHAGTGKTLTEATAATYLQTPGGTVALVSFASGKVGTNGAATSSRPGLDELRLEEKTKTLNPADAARILASIRDAAGHADCVIAYDHNHYWEASMQETPTWMQAWARACIEAGASAFVCHGEPLMHGIEIYHGKPIFYNLGNFAFQTKTQEKWKGPEIWESIVAKCVFEQGRLTSLTVVPLVLNDKGEAGARFIETRGWPRLATGERRDAILTLLKTLSAPYQTKFQPDPAGAKVVLPAAD